MNPIIFVCHYYVRDGAPSRLLHEALDRLAEAPPSPPAPQLTLGVTRGCVTRGCVVPAWPLLLPGALMQRHSALWL